MTIDIGGNKITYDSTAPAAASTPLGSFYEALVGAEFTLTIDKNRKVTRIEGREKVLERLVKANPQMKSLVEQLLSEAALKELAEKALLGVKRPPSRDKD
jgi:hypothetical protein